MSTRRHGLMRPRGVARVIAAVLAAGLVAGFAASYLVLVGVGFWGVLLAVLLVLAVPVVAAMWSGLRDGR